MSAAIQDQDAQAGGHETHEHRRQGGSRADEGSQEFVWNRDRCLYHPAHTQVDTRYGSQASSHALIQSGIGMRPAEDFIQSARPGSIIDKPCAVPAAAAPKAGGGRRGGRSVDRGIGDSPAGR
jgi:hypothetical protein